MAKQVLVLEPRHELTFRGPFTDVVTTTLKLRNPLKKNVVFRVEPTVPYGYQMQPSSGLIQGRASVNVLVMLHPFNYDPNEASEHNFMVQSVIASSDTSDIDAVWKNVKPEAIMDSKLACVFELPDGSKKPPDEETNKIASTAEEKTDSSAVSRSEMYDLDDQEDKKIRDEYRRLQLEVQRLLEENNILEEDETPPVRKASCTGATVLTSPAFVKTKQLNGKQLFLAVMFLLIGVFIGKFVF